jgi:plasmid stabilization system protein ParE
MTLRILQEAETELDDAILRYESIEPGLGLRFKDEAKGIIGWIAENPELPRSRPNGYRRVNFKIFPYYIAYIIHDQTLWILAIAHQARRPEYWVGRKMAD